MIIASAILYPDGEIVSAHRHHEVIAIQAKFGISSANALQGFVDHTGMFYTREEAKAIALASKQIPETHDGLLYSEDIWPDSLESAY